MLLNYVWHTSCSYNIYDIIVQMSFYVTMHLFHLFLTSSGQTRVLIPTLLSTDELQIPDLFHSACIFSLCRARYCLGMSIGQYKYWVLLSLTLGIILFLSPGYRAIVPLYPDIMSTSNNVIEHIVLLKVKSDTSDDDIKKLVEGAQSLRAIPGVISITVGATFAEEWMPDRRNGHTHTLSVRLQSKEGEWDIKCSELLVLLFCL